jgi:hypothetical protein
VAVQVTHHPDHDTDGMDAGVREFGLDRHPIREIPAAT